MKIYQATVHQVIALAVIVASMTSCVDRDRYHIQGEMRGAEGEMVRLVKLDLATNQQIAVDSCQLSEGLFFFSGDINSPYIHSIKIDGSPGGAHLFLEPGDFFINGHVDSLGSAIVDGGPTDSLFRSYAVDDLFDEQIGLAIMQNHPNSVLAAFTAYYHVQLHPFNADSLTVMVEHMGDEVKSSGYYPHLIALLQQLKSVSVGHVAPDFVMQDAGGQLVQLSDIAGEFLLLEFWASWCAPCREVNPQLVDLYHAYHPHGFAIVGISIDHERERWLKAIHDDALPWPNLSSLDGWGDVSSQYGIKAIPQNNALRLESDERLVVEGYSERGNKH